MSYVSLIQKGKYLDLKRIPNSEQRYRGVFSSATRISGCYVDVEYSKADNKIRVKTFAPDEEETEGKLFVNFSREFTAFLVYLGTSETIRIPLNGEVDTEGWLYADLPPLPGVQWQ
ncbi:TPA: hypothetical protein ACQ8UR_004546 [Escherichia coli]